VHFTPPPSIWILTKHGLLAVEESDLLIALLLWPPNGVDKFNMTKEVVEIPGGWPPLAKASRVGTNCEAFHRDM
jgi:hypothetical protein